MKFYGKNTTMRIFILTLILSSSEILAALSKMKQAPTLAGNNLKSPQTSIIQPPIDLFRFSSSKTTGDVNSNTEIKNEISMNSEILNSKPPSDNEESETEVVAGQASAGTTFKWGYLFWNVMDYSASNCLPGHSGWWQSQQNVKDDWWEAMFNTPQKIDVMAIKWKNPPKRFKIYFKFDDSVDWIPATEVHEKSSYVTAESQMEAQDAVAYQNAILFGKPMIAKRVRISLSEPLKKGSFAISEVRFYEKKSTVIVKNEMFDPCKNYCWYVNSDKPRENLLVEVYPCIDALAQGNNNEMFVQNSDRSVHHVNSMMCVGFNNANEIVLKGCTDYATAFTIQVRGDLTIYFDGYPDKCIYIDDKTRLSPNFVNTDTEIIASSEADKSTFKKDNIKDDGENYWQSAPGDAKATVYVLFGKQKDGSFETKKVDIIKIEWVREPENFSLYTWSPGETWQLRQSYSDYTMKISQINLIGIEAAGIMIRMEKSRHHEDLGGLPAYAMKHIYIGYNAMKLKTIECKAKPDKYKIFDFDPQKYKKTEKTAPAKVAQKKVSRTYEKAVAFYKKLQNEVKQISALHEKATTFTQTFNQNESTGKETVKKLMNFASNDLITVRDSQFEKFLEKKKEVSFLSALRRQNTGSAQLGTLAYPANDCIQIKRTQVSALSGFYYIKTECTPKPLRVFCDFTSYGDAVDIYVFNDGANTPNPDLSYLGIQDQDDVRYQCAKIGLNAIQIYNTNMVERIHQILTTFGYNLAKPLAVPLGYDYTCKMHKCSGMINSISDINSDPIMEFFEKTNKVGVLTTPGPMAGLGYSERPVLVTFDPKHTIITALICSTNHFLTDSSDTGVKIISCGMNVANNGDLFQEGTDVLVKCPQACGKDTGDVYGHGLYHDKSAVCGAALHFGAIGPSGGKINVRITKGQDKYFGILANGITSKDYDSKDGARGFTVEKFVPMCPINRFANKKGENDNVDNLNCMLEKEIEMTDGEGIIGKETNETDRFRFTEFFPSKAGVSLQGKNIGFNASAGINPGPNAGIGGKLDVGLGARANIPKVGESDYTALAALAELGRTYNREAGIPPNVYNGVFGVGPNHQLQVGFDPKTGISGQLTGRSDDGKSGGLVGEADTSIQGRLEPGFDPRNFDPVALNIGSPPTEKSDLYNKKFGIGKPASQVAPPVPHTQSYPPPPDQPTAEHPWNIIEPEGDEAPKGPQKNVKCQPTTEDSMRLMEQIRKTASYETIDQMKIKAEKINDGVFAFRKQIAWGDSNSPLSCDSLAKRLHKLLSRKTKVFSTIKKLSAEANARVYRTGRLQEKWQKDLDTLSEVDPFKLDYSIEENTIIAKTFKIFDVKGDIKSNWSVHTSAIKSRSKAMGCTSAVLSQGQLAGSILSLKTAQYFDFTLNVDILFRSTGIGGIVFRKMDNFNYYAFIINKQTGFKALAKIVNGQTYNIKTILDGGIQINDWHSVTITARAGHVKVYIYDKEQVDKASSERTLEMTDHTFVRGSVGFFVNNMNGFFFDAFTVQPETCWTTWKPILGLKIININASAYTETFRGTIDSKFYIYDIPNGKDGPTEWAMNSEQKIGSKVGVFQKSLVYDSSPDQRPSMLIMKDKTFTNGSFTVTFYSAHGDGTVSVIFKFHNEKNTIGQVTESFYTFDLINDRASGSFRLRKYHDGAMTELKSMASPIPGLQRLGYEPRRINVVRILVINERITISVSIDNSPMTNVFNLDDTSVKTGAVGIGTYRVKAEFTSLEIMPPELRFTEADKNFILTNDLDYIPMPDCHAIMAAANDMNGRVPRDQTQDALSIVTDQCIATGSSMGKIFTQASTSIKITNESTVNNNGMGTENQNREALNSNTIERISNLSKGWNICVVSRTMTQRRVYCEGVFSPFKRELCQNNFCHECCKAHTTPDKQNIYHLCEKSCTRGAIADELNNDYESVCLESQVPNQSIYNFCESEMHEYDQKMLNYCKLDMCNLCCSTLDHIKKKKYSFQNILKCLEACSKSI